MSTPTPLVSEFPPATADEWEALVRGKAKDPDAPLVTELEDGLTAKWLYTKGDALAADPGGLPGAAPFVRGTRGARPWAIRQRCDAPEPRAANAQILEELEGGASEILLACGPEPGSTDTLDAILAGVYLDMAPVALDGATDPAPLLELWRRRGHDPAEIRGSLRLDPIGRGAPGTLQQTIEAAERVHAEFPHVQVIAVDTSPYVDSGAGAREELALALSTAIAYLRTAQEHGIDPAQTAQLVEFTLTTGPDQFLEIAKLRAFRRLWAQVLAHCGVPEEGRRSRVYACTSRRMVSSLDPWNNILRETIAAFAAGAGGADGITVLPFDEPVGETVTRSTPLARRIARNTQLVLIEEASLHRVVDPAGGSWYVESLTDEIARGAWGAMQQIESAGGIREALRAGRVAALLAAHTTARQEALAHRRREMTGVNIWPLLGDDGLERAPVVACEATAEVAAEVNTRDAAQFEALRERARRLGTPKLLLASVGPLASHVNANLWAKSFFESGGVETVPSGVDPEIPALVAEHGVRAAAVCAGSGGDPAPAVAALRGAGVRWIYAVGRDVDGAERVRDGVDMIAVLGALLDHYEEAAE